MRDTKVIKPATIKSPNSLFNMWSVPLEDGLLGYASFPTASGLHIPYLLLCLLSGAPFDSLINQVI